MELGSSHYTYLFNLNKITDHTEIRHKQKEMGLYESDDKKAKEHFTHFYQKHFNINMNMIYK